MAGTKRGAHLMLSLERLEELTDRAARSASRLSATQRPLDEIARFLGGATIDATDRSARDRSPSSTPAPARSSTSRSSCPIDDMGALGERVEAPIDGPAAASPGRRSIWPVDPSSTARTGREPPLDADLRPTPGGWRAPGHPAQRAGRSRRRRAPSDTGRAPTVIVGAGDEQTGRRYRGRGARQGPPRVALPRAATPDRGRAEAG